MFHLEYSSELSTRSLSYGPVLITVPWEEKLFNHSVSLLLHDAQHSVRHTVGPQNTCKEMGSLVSVLILIQCVLLSHHSPAGITAILMGKLLNPNFSITYYSLYSPSFISHVGPVHPYSLRLIFSSYYSLPIKFSLILSHSILNFTTTVKVTLVSLVLHHLEILSYIWKHHRSMPVIWKLWTIIILVPYHCYQMALLYNDSLCMYWLTSLLRLNRENHATM